MGSINDIITGNTPHLERRRSPVRARLLLWRGAADISNLSSITVELKEADPAHRHAAHVANHFQRQPQQRARSRPERRRAHGHIASPFSPTRKPTWASRATVKTPLARHLRAHQRFARPQNCPRRFAAERGRGRRRRGTARQCGHAHLSHPGAKRRALLHVLSISRPSTRSLRRSTAK